jgi:hypothetical protein
MIEEPTTKPELLVVFFFMGGGTIGRAFDPDQISTALGIEPDEARSVGSQIAPSEGVTWAPSQTSAWFLRAPGAPHDELENQVRSLLDRLQPVEDRLRRLQERYVSGIDCLLHLAVGEVHPRLVLPSDLLARLASLHLRIGFSVQCFPALEMRQDP